MSDAAFILGFPVEFKQLCLVYPPKVKEVVSNSKYTIYSRLLTFSQEEIEDEYTKNGMELKDVLNPFEYILNNSFHNKDFYELAREAFKFFLHEDVIFLYEQKMVVIGNEEDLLKVKSVDDLRILREEDYFDFQNLIRRAIGCKEVERPNPNEDPRVKRIKAKARYRDMIKAKSSKGLKLESTLASICCMGFGLNPLNIGELSYAAVPLLISTFQEKEKYELDIRSLLAGADSKKVKPVYWIRNIDD